MTNFQKEQFYKLYIELSPRGAGKTFRLVKHAIEFLENDIKNKVNIVSPSNRTSNYIKEKLGKRFKSRVLINKNIKSNSDKNIKTYYEEFDYNDKLKNIDKCGYYCSSVAKIRNLTKLDNNDFLIKLLNCNGGQYSSYMIVGIDEMNGDKFFEMFTEEEKHSEGFQLEFLNKWMEI
jgi:thymidine kinase